MFKLKSAYKKVTGTSESRFFLYAQRVVVILTADVLLFAIGIASDVVRLGTLRFLMLGFFLCIFSVLSFVYMSSGSGGERLFRFVDKNGKIAALTGALACLVIMSIAMIRLYTGFDTWIDFDLCLRNQAFWRFIHGTGFISTIDSSGAGISNFGIHSAYVYFLVMPVYWLFPHPLTLMLTQACAVALGGYLLFRCLGRRTTTEVALGCAVAYWVSVLICAAAFHGVHEITYGPPMLVMMYDSFFRNKPRRFLLWTFLLLMVKETMPFVVGGFAVLSIIKRRSWVWWFLPAVLAAGIAAVNFGFVFPHLRSGLGTAYMGLDFLPKSPAEWLAHAPDKMRYLLVLGVLFLVLGPVSVYTLPVLAEIGINMISMNSCHIDLNRHYTIFIAIAFLVSTALVIDVLAQTRFLNRVVGNRRRTALWLVTVVVLAQLVVSPLLIQRLPLGVQGNTAAVWGMIDSVPPDATVMASHGFLAALSSRQRIFCFYNTFDRLNECDYLLIDGAFLPSWYPADAREKISGLMANPHSDTVFEPVLTDRQTMLMRKRNLRSQ